MNYNYILELKRFRTKLQTSNKEFYTKKDNIPKVIINCIFRPAKKEKVIINIHLPQTTNKDNGYIPMELFEKYYKKGKDGLYHRKESGENITFPFKTERYCYSKKQLLENCNEYIQFYIKNINGSILCAERRIEKEKERIENLEELLSA